MEPKATRYARVYWISGGTTRYKSGGSAAELQHGKLYLFPTHAPYELVTDPDDPIDCLFLHLELHTSGITNPICIDPEQNPEFQNLLQLFHSAICSYYPISHLELLAQSLESLCLIKKFFAPIDPQTQQLMDLIRSTYRTSLPLEQLASSQGYTTEAFIRLFRRHIGITPHQYAISLRMNDAVRLLARNLPLDEVAQSVGYSDGHSFSGAFRS